MVNEKFSPRVTKWHELDFSYRHVEVPKTPKTLCLDLNATSSALLPDYSPFLTLLGGAFLSFGPEVFTFCVAFIDASSQEHGVLTILVTKTLNNLLICR